MQAKYGGVWWVSGWCLRVSSSVRMVSECVRQMSGVGRCHMQCQKLAETARLSENDTQKHQKRPKNTKNAIFFQDSKRSQCHIFSSTVSETYRTDVSNDVWTANDIFFWPGLRSPPLCMALRPTTRGASMVHGREKEPQPMTLVARQAYPNIPKDPHIMVASEITPTGRSICMHCWLQKVSEGWRRNLIYLHKLWFVCFACNDNLRYSPSNMY